MFKLSYMLMPGAQHPFTVTAFEFCSQVDCSPAGRGNAQGQPSHITAKCVYVSVHSASVRTQKLVPGKKKRKRKKKEEKKKHDWEFAAMVTSAAVSNSSGLLRSLPSPGGRRVSVEGSGGGVQSMQRNRDTEHWVLHSPHILISTFPLIILHIQFHAL